MEIVMADSSLRIILCSRLDSRRHVQCHSFKNWFHSNENKSENILKNSSRSWLKFHEFDFNFEVVNNADVVGDVFAWLNNRRHSKISLKFLQQLTQYTWAWPIWLQSPKNSKCNQMLRWTSKDRVKKRKTFFSLHNLNFRCFSFVLEIRACK